MTREKENSRDAYGAVRPDQADGARIGDYLSGIFRRAKALGNPREDRRGLGGFYLEAEKIGASVRLNIHGIIGIFGCSNERIEMKSHGGKISVAGEELEVRILDKCAIEITGKIREVGFGYAKT